MIMQHNTNIQDIAISKNILKLTNQIYKLLPNREENIDWEKPLATIIEELAGMSEMFLDQHEIFFSLLCKLKGLFELNQPEDFLLFRRTIFESLGLMNSLYNYVRTRES